MAEERYFVKANEDAPEKGPYTLDLIKKSHERGMLKGEAICRLENGKETYPLSTLLGQPTPADASRSRGGYDGGMRDRTRDELEHASRQQAASAGSANLVIGLIMVAAGIGLTFISMSAAGGGGAIFIGLIVFGFIRMIRGAASS
jgi:hypothetical protein